MVNVKAAAIEIGKLGMLKYFPADQEARKSIVQMVCEMASSDDQVKWLVERVLASFNEWPGPAEIRKVFVSRFRPRDGIAVSICSCGCGQAQEFRLSTNQVWPPQVEAPELKQLPAGRPTPEEAEADRKALAELWADYKPKPHVIATRKRDFRDLLRETITAPKDRRELPVEPDPAGDARALRKLAATGERE